MNVFEDGRIEGEKRGDDVKADAFALLDHTLIDLVIAF